MVDDFDDVIDFGPTGPRVENWVPARGSGLSKFTATIGFDALGFEAAGYRERVYVRMLGRADEPVFDGDSFTDEYSLSTREAIADGYRYVIRRNRGWPSNPLLGVRAEVDLYPAGFDVGFSGGFG